MIRLSLHVNENSVLSLHLIERLFGLQPDVFEETIQEPDNAPTVSSGLILPR